MDRERQNFRLPMKSYEKAWLTGTPRNSFRRCLGWPGGGRLGLRGDLWTEMVRRGRVGQSKLGSIDVNLHKSSCQRSGISIYRPGKSCIINPNIRLFYNWMTLTFQTSKKTEFAIKHRFCCGNPGFWENMGFRCFFFPANFCSDLCQIKFVACNACKFGHRSVIRIDISPKKTSKHLSKYRCSGEVGTKGSPRAWHQKHGVSNPRSWVAAGKSGVYHGLSTPAFSHQKS